MLAGLVGRKGKEKEAGDQVIDKSMGDCGDGKEDEKEKEQAFIGARHEADTSRGMFSGNLDGDQADLRGRNHGTAAAMTAASEESRALKKTMCVMEAKKYSIGGAASLMRRPGMRKQRAR